MEEKSVDKDSKEGKDSKDSKDIYSDTIHSEKSVPFSPRPTSFVSLSIFLRLRRSYLFPSTPPRCRQ